MPFLSKIVLTDGQGEIFGAGVIRQLTSDFRRTVKIATVDYKSHQEIETMTQSCEGKFNVEIEQINSLNIQNLLGFHLLFLYPSTKMKPGDRTTIIDFIKGGGTVVLIASDSTGDSYLENFWSQITRIFKSKVRYVLG